MHRIAQPSTLQILTFWPSWAPCAVLLGWGYAGALRHSVDHPMASSDANRDAKVCLTQTTPLPRRQHPAPGLPLIHHVAARVSSSYAVVTAQVLFRCCWLVNHDFAEAYAQLDLTTRTLAEPSRTADARHWLGGSGAPARYAYPITPDKGPLFGPCGGHHRRE